MNNFDIEHSLQALRAAQVPHATLLKVDYFCGGSVLDSEILPPDTKPFYRVYMELQPARGSFIRVIVLLPEAWNGRLVGFGNGGMAGHLNSSLLCGSVQNGFAATQTDMGTSRGRNSGAHNPEVWKDFGWRATHLMTQTAKQLIEVLYGRKADYAYFIGMSTGGQQAMAEAQRFPEDYDGICAGVPAFNRVYLHTYFLWMYRLLRPHGEPQFTDEELQKVMQCAVEFHQQRGDGAANDNFVTQPIADAENIAVFMAFLREKISLSEKQYEVLQQLYLGPVHPRTGKQIYNGVPVGSEAMPNGMMMKNDEHMPNAYPFYWAFGADYDLNAFDFDRDLDCLAKLLNEDLNANDTNLLPFMKRGGKLLMFSGVADPLVPYQDAVRYYNAVCERFGLSQTQEFFRFFLLPGKDHSNRGDGTNVWGRASLPQHMDAFFAEPFPQHPEMLNMIVEWVETQHAPEEMAAVRASYEDPSQAIAFARPIYPYPAKSVYKGGDPTKPTAFECEEGVPLCLPVCEYV